MKTVYYKHSQWEVLGESQDGRYITIRNLLTGESKSVMRALCRRGAK